MPGYDHKLTPLRDKRPIDRVPDLEYGLVAERQLARIQYGSDSSLDNGQNGIERLPKKKVMRKGEIKHNPYIEGVGPFKSLIGTDPPQRIQQAQLPKSVQQAQAIQSSHKKNSQSSGYLSAVSIHPKSPFNTNLKKNLNPNLAKLMLSDSSSEEENLGAYGAELLKALDKLNQQMNPKIAQQNLAEVDKKVKKKEMMQEIVKQDEEPPAPLLPILDPNIIPQPHIGVAKKKKRKPKILMQQEYQNEHLDETVNIQDQLQEQQQQQIQQVANMVTNKQSTFKEDPHQKRVDELPPHPVITQQVIPQKEQQTIETKVPAPEPRSQIIPPQVIPKERQPKLNMQDTKQNLIEQKQENEQIQIKHAQSQESNHPLSRQKSQISQLQNQNSAPVVQMTSIDPKPPSKNSSNKVSVIVLEKPPSIPVNMSPMQRKLDLIKKQKEKNKPREYGKKRDKTSFSAFYSAAVVATQVVPKSLRGKQLNQQQSEGDLSLKRGQNSKSRSPSKKGKSPSKDDVQSADNSQLANSKKTVKGGENNIYEQSIHGKVEGEVVDEDPTSKLKQLMEDNQHLIGIVKQQTPEFFIEVEEPLTEEQLEALMKEPQFKERYEVYQEMKKRLRQLNQEENEEALSARLRDVRKRVKNLIKDTRSSPIKEVAIIQQIVEPIRHPQLEDLIQPKGLENYHAAIKLPVHLLDPTVETSQGLIKQERERYMDYIKSISPPPLQRYAHRQEDGTIEIQPVEYHIYDNKLTLSMKHLEAVKLEHEEMRLQCQRVLANPYYMEDLKSQIKTLDSQISTEQIIQGKLKYLGSMYRQVDHQEQEEQTQAKTYSQQAEIDRLFAEIGETSGRCEHLLLQIQAIGTRVEETNITRDILDKELIQLQEEGKKYDFHLIISQDNLLMKHKIMKVQADIDRVKADKENARTVFEIRVNKMRHEENESRRAILEKQKIVSQKMRINENQRLIIIDLMDVVEQVEEAFEQRQQVYNEISVQVTSSNENNLEDLGSPRTDLEQSNQVMKDLDAELLHNQSDNPLHHPTQNQQPEKQQSIENQPNTLVSQQDQLPEEEQKQANSVVADEEDSNLSIYDDEVDDNQNEYKLQQKILMNKQKFDQSPRIEDAENKQI